MLFLSERCSLRPKLQGLLCCLKLISGECYLLQFLDCLYQAAMLQPPYCLTVVQPWCLS